MKHKIATPALMIALLVINVGCQKNEPANNNNTTGTVTDIDGNVYNTIKIGNQIWMKENLKVTHYRDGTAIQNVSDGWDWWHVSTGAYCEYENLSSNGSTYGKLYNWYAVNTGILAPTGWHVPTEAEWTVLENFLGNASTAGGRLKEAGTNHWQSPNVEATNATGFTGLPGGERTSTGSFFNLTYSGYWWANTEGTDIAYGRYHWLDFNSGFLLKNEDYKVDGCSVRCIKD